MGRFNMTVGRYHIFKFSGTAVLPMFWCFQTFSSQRWDDRNGPSWDRMKPDLWSSTVIFHWLLLPTDLCVLIIFPIQMVKVGNPWFLHGFLAICSIFSPFSYGVSPPLFGAQPLNPPHCLGCWKASASSICKIHRSPCRRNSSLCRLADTSGMEEPKNNTCLG